MELAHQWKCSCIQCFGKPVKTPGPSRSKDSQRTFASLTRPNYVIQTW